MFKFALADVTAAKAPPFTPDFSRKGLINRSPDFASTSGLKPLHK
jgi:hypothetical protein